MRHKLTLVLGHEDVVVRHSDRWMKVKPEETHDVAIIGFGEDRDKHVGRIGFITIALGNVGSGFSDEEWIELRAEA